MILHQRQVVKSSDGLSQQSSVLLTKLKLNWVVWEVTDQLVQSESEAILGGQESYSQENLKSLEALSSSNEGRLEREPVTQLSGIGNQPLDCRGARPTITVTYHRTKTVNEIPEYLVRYWDFQALARFLRVKEPRQKYLGFISPGYLEVSRDNRMYTETVFVLDPIGIYQVPKLEQLFEFGCGYFLACTQGIEDMPLTQHILYSHGITFQVITGIGFEPINGFKSDIMAPYISLGRKEFESWLIAMNLI